MKVPKVRDNLVSGSGYGHSSYTHWTESVDDFILWQDYWKSVGHDLNNYYSFLVELPYAVDRFYVKKLQRLVI